MGMFLIYCEHTSGLILFLIPLHLDAVEIGTKIHSIFSNRQILEEVVLIILLSLWLKKEDKDKMHLYLKTQSWLKETLYTKHIKAPKKTLVSHCSYPFICLTICLFIVLHINPYFCKTFAIV